MEGAPAPVDKRVTLANWEDPPFSRWAFSHVRELIPTARIGRGDGPVTPFERDERDLTGISFEHRGKRTTVGEMLDATSTDSMLVLKDGRIVTEWYDDGSDASTAHLLMSVSKSLTSALVGVMVDRGLIETEAEVPSYVDELRGTSFDGCTVQHLLDMRAGTRWSEDYEDPESDAHLYEEVMGWRPRRPGRDLPDDLYDYMAGLHDNAGPHGGPFEYRSILTNVLGWVLERAGGATFAELFSREIWSRIGAERDAEITVDTAGCALEDGGICTTLRDLARIGQLYLDRGEIGGRRVLPSAWTERPTTADPELIEAFEAAPEAHFHPGGMYHDCWWCLDPERGIFTGLGIHGQQLLVHRPAGVVVAKFSTQPMAYEIGVEQLQIWGSLAICDALAG
jgi:CubicO group peptidase (beta-lactamase class C family)